MKVFNLGNMTNGWFVGNFFPSAYLTSDVEVAIKKYKSGAYEASHHHKIATEITVIIEGSVRMNGVVHNAGDILVIEPNSSTDFMALTDVVTAVVKHPGASNDKYLG